MLQQIQLCTNNLCSYRVACLDLSQKVVQYKKRDVIIAWLVEINRKSKTRLIRRYAFVRRELLAF